MKNIQVTWGLAALRVRMTWGFVAQRFRMTCLSILLVALFFPQLVFAGSGGGTKSRNVTINQTIQQNQTFNNVLGGQYVQSYLYRDSWGYVGLTPLDELKWAHYEYAGDYIATIIDGFNFGFRRLMYLADSLIYDQDTNTFSFDSNSVYGWWGQQVGGISNTYGRFMYGGTDKNGVVLFDSWYVTAPKNYAYITTFAGGPKIQSEASSTSTTTTTNAATSQKNVSFISGGNLFSINTNNNQVTVTTTTTQDVYKIVGAVYVYNVDMWGLYF